MTLFHEADAFATRAFAEADPPPPRLLPPAKPLWPRAALTMISLVEEADLEMVQGWGVRV